MDETINGVPVLMLSDIHYSENVTPAEVGYVNEYNSSISNTRVNFTVDAAIKIILHDWTAYNTDWFVLPLIGDIVSGAIHDELAESNDKRILVATLEITDILIYQIKKLKQHFNHIYVPCVVGNHGRLHKKPRAKGFVQENYEYVVYKLIEREFSNDDSVIVQVSESPDLRFDIFGKRFLMTHGNTLGGGGNGIAGILPLLYRGNYKKQERETSVNNSYDVLLIGHYHTSLFLGKVIVNGTTKGVDEYALNFLNIGYEPPSQNLFMVDRNFNDITYRLPIFCEPSDNIKIEHTIKTYI
jgi:predicted phosphodiesterase